ncbi:hypothetical protein H4R33_006824 [Dimargaris cristalligena]|uniref:Transmembrane protein n=1 Tax=Dimargaris cristalligena TaxID=215637 RepID=A0A4P9ZNT1_9FUNG|nr:hypothetical protein H4R33_006824 [Dimargaris cristalligena]RKP34271.1 hypothetical protein BJ085DRAFT_33939 [Dimargaris cristalligena]|eukprot:RKP34271.1 hypothetical protein BJ085DRAFT_33939 [Dimargaris cristalligena]
MPLPPVVLFLAGSAAIAAVVGVILLHEANRQRWEHSEHHQHRQDNHQYHQQHHWHNTCESNEPRHDTHTNEPENHISLDELNRPKEPEKQPHDPDQKVRHRTQGQRRSGTSSSSSSSASASKPARRPDQSQRDSYYESVQQEHSYLKAMEQDNERRRQELLSERQQLKELEADVEARRHRLAQAGEGNGVSRSTSGATLSAASGTNNPWLPGSSVRVPGSPPTLFQSAPHSPPRGGSVVDQVVPFTLPMSAPTSTAPPSLPDHLLSPGFQSQWSGRDASRLLIPTSPPASDPFFSAHEPSTSPSMNPFPHTPSLSSVGAPPVPLPSLMLSPTALSARMSDMSTVLTALEDSHESLPMHAPSSTSSRLRGSIAAMRPPSEDSWVELQDRYSDRSL